MKQSIKSSFSVKKMSWWEIVSWLLWSRREKQWCHYLMKNSTNVVQNPSHNSKSRVPFYIKTTVRATSYLKTKYIMTYGDLCEISEKYSFHNNKKKFLFNLFWGSAIYNCNFYLNWDLCDLEMCVWVCVYESILRLNETFTFMNNFVLVVSLVNVDAFSCRCICVFHT